MGGRSGFQVGNRWIGVAGPARCVRCRRVGLWLWRCEAGPGPSAPGKWISARHRYNKSRSPIQPFYPGLANGGI